MQSTGYSSAAPQGGEPANPAASASTDAFKKLLTGPGSGQMNLRAVKERGFALRKSLEEFIDILQFQPHLLTWETSLERFGVMGVRHQQLVEQLRPLLKFYTAHPKAVNQSNAEVLPLLLSTMRLPEIEAEEAGLLSEHDSAVASRGLANYYEQLGNDIERFNQLIGELTSHSDSIADSGVLDPKGPRRRAMAQELRTAVNTISKAPSKASKMRPSADGGAEALLAAALTGKGL